MRARLGWIQSSIPFYPIEMLLPLPLRLSIEPPPCAICPLPGGRWHQGRRGSSIGGYSIENSGKSWNLGVRITINCYFRKQNEVEALTMDENIAGRTIFDGWKENWPTKCNLGLFYKEEMYFRIPNTTRNWSKEAGWSNIDIDSFD